MHKVYTTGAPIIILWIPGSTFHEVKASDLNLILTDDMGRSPLTFASTQQSMRMTFEPKSNQCKEPKIQTHYCCDEGQFSNPNF